MVAGTISSATPHLNIRTMRPTCLLMYYFLDQPSEIISSLTDFNARGPKSETEVSSKAFRTIRMASEMHPNSRVGFPSLT